MKNRIVFIIFFSLIAQSIFSQFKNERRIYLWDVTLSMKGQGSLNEPDIYDNVVKAIEIDINSISDEETEIIVLPFQVNILEEWKGVATAVGKADIIRKIKSYNNTTLSYTNINKPFKEIINKYLSKERRDIVLLLTDGVQNDKNESIQDFISTIQKWCSISAEKDAYAFYVMLTNFAKDERILSAIRNSCRITPIEVKNPTQGIDINFVELLPTQNIKYNIKDDAGKKIKLSFSCKKNIEIPTNTKIKVISEENPYLDVNSITLISGNSIEFEVKLKDSYTNLKKQLPQDRNEKLALYISVENEGNNGKVSLISDVINFELINKPEKTLRIYVED